jgi:ubiquinone/menaquinone biosynthesis C-methylase UbiE
VSSRHHHPHHHHHEHDWRARLDDPKRDEWQRPTEIVAAMEITAGMTVADIGAGTGYFVPHLLRVVGAAGRVIAIDADPDLVSHLRHRFAGSNVEASGALLSDASVDRVLIVDVWHHMNERVEFAKRLKRALKPGGRVCIVDAHHDAPEGPPVELRLSAKTVLGELNAAGFDPSVVLTLPKQFVVLAQPR